MPTVAVDSDGCYALILATDKKMQRDAGLAMLAIAVLLGAHLCCKQEPTVGPSAWRCQRR